MADPMSSSRANPDTLPDLTSEEQSYEGRIVSAFNQLLSPQVLPFEQAVRDLMNEELWMSLRKFIKLPCLQKLSLGKKKIPFLVTILREQAFRTIEVDTAKRSIRPIWALKSSVFITNVATGATDEHILGLLQPALVHSATAGPLAASVFNPHELTIVRHSPMSWSIIFKAPTAAAHAMWMINGQFIGGIPVFPLLVVTICPRSPLYSNLRFMEVGACRNGAPVVPYFSMPHFEYWLPRMPSNASMFNPGNHVTTPAVTTTGPLTSEGATLPHDEVAATQRKTTPIVSPAKEKVSLEPKSKAIRRSASMINLTARDGCDALSKSQKSVLQTPNEITRSVSYQEISSGAQREINPLSFSAADDSGMRRNARGTEPEGYEEDWKTLPFKKRGNKFRDMRFASSNNPGAH